jgi:hypothetical protein
MNKCYNEQLLIKSESYNEHRRYTKNAEEYYLLWKVWL